jgi:hypothetical protein
LNALTKIGSGHVWFRLFKYTIYCLLAWNVWLFFLDDYAASAEVFVDGVTWRNVVEAFSATVDTLAWVILLLLFELETAIIPDDKLRGRLKWVLTAIRGVCYAFIVYAFYGYVAKYFVVTDLIELGRIDVCALVGDGYAWVSTLDEYPRLTAEACAAMQGQPILRIDGTQIIGTPESLALAKSLALTDIINAGDWLIIVALLEGEIWLQLKGVLSDRMLAVNKWLKGLLYAVLFGCAIYWGIDGDFLDFWDAFLWLVAFIFIEMNIFEWHEETSDEASGAAAGDAGVG